MYNDLVDVVLNIHHVIVNIVFKQYIYRVSIKFCHIKYIARVETAINEP